MHLFNYNDSNACIFKLLMILWRDVKNNHTQFIVYSFKYTHRCHLLERLGQMAPNFFDLFLSLVRAFFLGPTLFNFVYLPINITYFHPPFMNGGQKIGDIYGWINKIKSMGLKNTGCSQTNYYRGWEERVDLMVGKIRDDLIWQIMRLVMFI